MATTKTTKVNHTLGLEAAMGMTFGKLNKLRGHACELKAFQNTRYFKAEHAVILGTLTAQIEAAHEAMAAYREAHNIDAWNRPRG